MKKRKKSPRKLALNRVTVRNLDELEAKGAVNYFVSLGNTRCSVTDGTLSDGGGEGCMETL